jgi:hypothetical protein
MRSILLFFISVFIILACSSKKDTVDKSALYLTALDHIAKSRFFNYYLLPCDSLIIVNKYAASLDKIYEVDTSYLGKTNIDRLQLLSFNKSDLSSLESGVKKWCIKARILPTKEEESFLKEIKNSKKTHMLGLYALMRLDDTYLVSFSLLRDRLLFIGGEIYLKYENGHFVVVHEDLAGG